MRENTLKSGEKTWTVFFRHGKTQTSETFGTKKAAARFKVLVEELGADRALKALDEEEGSPSRTLDDLFADWLKWKVARKDLTKRGAEDYQRDYDNWIHTPLGHRDPNLIDALDVQEWVDSMSGRLAAKTICDRHALLHGMFGWAAAKTRRLVENDPCTDTELPRRVKGHVRGLTLAEWQHLHTTAEQLDPDYADALLFAASTGWRFSEISALPAWAVDDDGEKVHVSMTQVQRRGDGIVPDAKSQAGLRRIELRGDAVPMIRRRLVGIGPADLVFTTKRGSRWHYTPYHRKWTAVVEAAGLTDRKPTPHWLRHTHVMLCHAAGMTLPEISRRLGHDDIQTSINVYGRMIDGMSDDVAARLDLLLSGRLPEIVAGDVVKGELED